MTPRPCVERPETNDGPSTAARLPRSVVIREVGLRDGLQSIATILSDRAKIEWIRARLRRPASARSRSAPSCRRACCRSWPTPPSWSPLPRRCRASFASVLVPNLQAAPKARIDGEADLMIVPLSASHAHSLANLRKTPDEVVAEVAQHPCRARCVRARRP